MFFGKIFLFVSLEAHADARALSGGNRFRAGAVFLSELSESPKRPRQANRRAFVALRKRRVRFLAGKTAQKCVDKSRNAALAQLFTEFYRGIGDHIPRLVHKKQHIQGNFEEGAHGELGRLRRITADTEIEIEIVFQNAVYDFYRPRAVDFLDVRIRDRLL